MFDDLKHRLIFWVTTQLEKKRSRKDLLRTLIFASLAEVTVFVAATLVPQLAVDAAWFAVSVEGKVALLLAAIPFTCGFLISFSLIKLKWQGRRAALSKKDFLSRYEEHSLRESQRFIFMICAGIGGLNAIIFYFALIAVR